MWRPREGKLSGRYSLRFGLVSSVPKDWASKRKVAPQRRGNTTQRNRRQGDAVGVSRGDSSGEGILCVLVMSLRCKSIERMNGRWHRRDGQIPRRGIRSEGDAEDVSRGVASREEGVLCVPVWSLRCQRIGRINGRSTAATLEYDAEESITGRCGGCRFGAWGN